MMKTPPKERVGKQQLQGLSVVIEGSDKSQVKAVVKKLQTLLPKDLIIKFDQSFDNRGEQIIHDTINLYHTVRAPIDPKTLSLLYIVSYSKRLELIAQAKKRGELALMTKSWLEDYRKLLENNLLEAATSLLDVALTITPDIWIIIDRKTRNYEKLQSATNAKIISNNKPVDEITYSIYSYLVNQTKQKPQQVISAVKEATPDASIRHSTTQIPQLPPKILQAYTTIYSQLKNNYELYAVLLEKQNISRHLADVIKPYSDCGLIYDAKASAASDYRPAIRSAKLRTYTPRNELDIATSVAFSDSNADFSAVQQRIDSLSYADKVALVKDSVIGRSTATLLISYDFELVAPLVDVATLQTHKRYLSLQTPNPLLGYDIPEEAEKVGAVELVQQSFDLSVQLYSLLQAADVLEQAHFATLGGHFMRCEAVVSLQDIIGLQNKITEQTMRLFYQSVVEVHPIIGEALQSINTIRNR